MRAATFPMAVLLLGAISCGEARAQVAEDAEDAQRFLIQMLQSGGSPFIVGNDISERETYGLGVVLPGTSTSYRKKMLGGWREINSFPNPVRLDFKFTNFDRVNEDGKYDDCTTSVENVEVVAARGPEGRFTFPPDGLSKEDYYGHEVKWIHRIEQDPKRFSGPYRIDWRNATFDRSKKARYGWIDFLIKTDQRVPYAQISAPGEEAADYVENAIRVLQLSCRP